MTRQEKLDKLMNDSVKFLVDTANKAKGNPDGEVPYQWWEIRESVVRALFVVNDEKKGA